MEEEKIMLPGQTPDGNWILSVLVKRSYLIKPDKACERTQAKKCVKGDSFYGDPKNTALEFESDLVPFKLATDIVFNGLAYVPDTRRKVSKLIASLIVGQYRKEILVIGDRTVVFNRLRPPTFTEPQPFIQMPIRYERAYGGIDIYSVPNNAYPYPRNPIGTGFVIKNTKASVQHLKLPNIEDPKAPLIPEKLIVGKFDSWTQQPEPQGLGWYHKCYQPRAEKAGILPLDQIHADEMREAYLSNVPKQEQADYDSIQLPKMNFKFFNGASTGLSVPYLQGDEKVTLLNLDANQQRFSFWLPSDKPEINMDIGQGAKPLQVVLHTLLIRQIDNQIDLVWRGAMPYPGPQWLPQMKRLKIEIQ